MKAVASLETEIQSKTKDILVDYNIIIVVKGEFGLFYLIFRSVSAFPYIRIVILGL